MPLLAALDMFAVKAGVNSALDVFMMRLLEMLWAGCEERQV